MDKNGIKCKMKKMYLIFMVKTVDGGRFLNPYSAVLSVHQNLRHIQPLSSPHLVLMDKPAVSRTVSTALTNIDNRQTALEPAELAAPGAMTCLHKFGYVQWQMRRQLQGPSEEESGDHSGGQCLLGHQFWVAKHVIATDQPVTKTINNSGKVQKNQAELTFDSN